jgi:hypothetical protein
MLNSVCCKCNSYDAFAFINLEVSSARPGYVSRIDNLEDNSSLILMLDLRFSMDARIFAYRQVGTRVLSDNDEPPHDFAKCNSMALSCARCVSNDIRLRYPCAH